MGGVEAVEGVGAEAGAAWGAVVLHCIMGSWYLMRDVGHGTYDI